MLLAGRHRSSKVVAQSLHDRFNLVGVVVEKPPSRRRLVQRRAKRLGWPKVADQLAFQVAAAPLVSRYSADRIQTLLDTHGFADSRFPDELTRHVDSVNSQATARAIQEARPHVIVLSGTRIVSKRILACVEAPFVNLHAGITPRYRGVHGGYWALAEQRADLCGVTLHLVDAGIDTGGVIAQARIHPGPHDTYATYPLLQLAAGLPLLIEAIPRLARGDRSTVSPMSQRAPLRYHPTLSGYLGTWWRYGVL